MPLDNLVNSRIRTANRLSALKVAKLKEPGLYEDGQVSDLSLLLQEPSDGSFD